MPGSEGNLASDIENQEPAAVAAPTTEEKPETQTESAGDSKPAAAEKPAPEKTTADGKTEPGADAKADEPSAPGPQSGQRKRHHGGASGQGQKNGVTLDLVELKDMSIQKLNQIAKDLGVTGTAGLRKQ